MCHMESIDVRAGDRSFLYFDTACACVNNILNVTNFCIRNLMTGLRKPVPERTANKRDVIETGNSSIPDVNRILEETGRSHIPGLQKVRRPEHGGVLKHRLRHKRRGAGLPLLWLLPGAGRHGRRDKGGRYPPSRGRVIGEDRTPAGVMALDPGLTI